MSQKKGRPSKLEDSENITARKVGEKPNFTIKKPTAHQPRHSAAFAMQLKVMRTCMERLMSERKTLKEVKSSLQDAVQIWDQQIVAVEKMQAIARAAQMFQEGKLRPDVDVHYDWLNQMDGNSNFAVDPEWLVKVKEEIPDVKFDISGV